MENNPPTFEELLDWLEGRLSAKESRRVASTIAAADESAQAELEWLRQFLELSQMKRSAEPPADVIARLEQRFADHYRRQSPSIWQRLVAGLSFDSHQELAARGARGGGAAEQRQYLYETEHATVVFTLQRREQGTLFDLIGQVVPSDESEVDLIRVYLLREGVEFDSTITDDLGGFILPAVPRGQYSMVLSTLSYEMTIPSIDLYT
jgi:hypothetical protein